MPQTTASRPGVEAGPDVGRVGDAAGREHRIVVGHRVADSGEQLRRRQPSRERGRRASTPWAITASAPAARAASASSTEPALVDPDLRGPALRACPRR